MQAPLHPTLVDPPSGTVILQLEQPAFAVRYPQIVNGGSIPVEILAAMEASWRQEHFAARPLTFHRLRDVFVVHEGLVSDATGRLYRSTITQHAPEEIASGLAMIREQAAGGSIASVAGPALLCAKRGGVNYGHFMLEMLPKACLATAHLPRDTIDPDALRYAVCRPDDTLWQVMVSAFALLGIDATRLIPITGAPTHFRELILVDGLSEHGSYMSPLALRCLERLAAPVPAGPARKLFVSRRENAPRRFSNEREIVDILRAHGFHPIMPGSLPLVQQIAAFNGARTILGAMGAGMTNIAFAGAGAAVTGASGLQARSPIAGNSAAPTTSSPIRSPISAMSHVTPASSRANGARSARSWVMSNGSQPRSARLLIATRPSAKRSTATCSDFARCYSSDLSHRNQVAKRLPSSTVESRQVK